MSDPKIQIIGILNVTPDSFSDGGRFVSSEAAITQAIKLAEEGATMIEIGGASSRPGSQIVSPELELERLKPVLECILDVVRVPIVVDTIHSSVAKVALDLGVSWINDISAMTYDRDMARVIANKGAGVTLMHMKGLPKDMQDNPIYEDVVADVCAYLSRQIHLAQEAGISQIWMDPGIGFGKTLDQNLMLLKAWAEFRDLGVPVMMGASRKSFINDISSAAVNDRLGGSLAAVLWGYLSGGRIFRVHDVLATAQALSVYQAIESQ